MRRAGAGLAAAVSLFAAPAIAELPVAYDADRAALKAALRVGDPIELSLFTDPACAGDALFSETLAVGSAFLAIEEVAPVALKRERPKPPAIARLRATLAAPIAAGPIYARAEGAGVEAIGAACQRQASPVAGTPGPEPGALFWLDADGATVGRVVDAQTVFIETLGLMAAIQYGTSAPFLTGCCQVSYESSDCSGEPLTQIAGSRLLVTRGPRFFRAATEAVSSDVVVRSGLGPENGLCVPFPQRTDALVPATEIFPTGPGLSEPLAGPLHVEVGS